MCGRFPFYFTLKDAAKEYMVKDLPEDFAPNYNAAPMQKVPVIYVKESAVHFEMFRWGLVPHWAKDSKIGSRMINARFETIFEKPSFKNLISGSRCLMLANGFYEWKKTDDRKIPNYIQLKNRQIFGFAAIWSQWKSPIGENLKTCSIITTAANDFMKPIHNRMPVTVMKRDEKKWLTDNNTQNIKEIIRQGSSEEMKSFEISTLVNNPNNNSPECIAPSVSR